MTTAKPTSRPRPRPRRAIARLSPRLLAPSLAGYRREWLAGDAAAAVTLLVIAVPEQLATSRLAGMPPITGFLAFIAGSLMFALLGSNPRISVGADSTIAPLFAVGVSHLARLSSPHYVALVAVLAVMVGAILAVVWLLRLGWVSELLSLPIITGFLGGVAIVIVVHQLPDLLGIAEPRGSTLHRLVEIIDHLGAIHAWPVAIGLFVFTCAWASERIDRRLPGALAGFVLATLITGIADLRAHGVAVLGPIGRAAPHLGLPALSLNAIGQLAPLAGVVALVVITQSAATTRAFPPRDSEPASVNRDLLGVGAGNVVAGIVGAFPVNASPPRTAAVARAAGRTQLSGLLAAVAMAVLLPAAGILRNVPLAALAGMLLFVAARIFHVRDLRAVARFDRLELCLAIVTLLAVPLLGVEEGIGVAVGLAILDRTRRSAQPQLHVLGRIAGTTSWAPLSSAAEAEQLPGVLVVLFATPLWYANASHFRAQLDVAMTRTLGRPRLVVLDAVGMSDIDFTGSAALAGAVVEIQEAGAVFAVARAGERLTEGLRRSGLLARIGEGHLFPAVNEAVVQLAAAHPEPAKL